MPPAAATAAARRSTARRAAPASQRRVSGSGKQARLAAGIRTTSPSRASRAPRGGAHAAPPPLALKLGGALRTAADHRLVDRLIRGRMWIAILGTGLIGIVFMQVSMLKLNAGIGASVERASTLERQNSALQSSISQLTSSDRISEAAAAAGMIRPSDATANFLDARNVSFSRAVRGITPPDASFQVASAAAATAATTTTTDLTQQAQGTATQQTATAQQQGTVPATTTQTGIQTQTQTGTQAATAQGAAVSPTQQTQTATTATQTVTPTPNPAGQTVGGGAAATGP